MSKLFIRLTNSLKLLVEGRQFAKRLNCNYYEVSSKDNVNIVEPMHELVRKIRIHWQQRPDLARMDKTEFWRDGRETFRLSFRDKIIGYAQFYLEKYMPGR